MMSEQACQGLWSFCVQNFTKNVTPSTFVVDGQVETRWPTMHVIQARIVAGQGQSIQSRKKSSQSHETDPSLDLSAGCLGKDGWPKKKASLRNYQ